MMTYTQIASLAKGNTPAVVTSADSAKKDKQTALRIAFNSKLAQLTLKGRFKSI